MTTNSPERRGLPSPLDVPVPPACEGWEDMYPYHAVFSEDRRAFDDGRFWFQDSLHGPEPVHPFDFVWWDYAVAAMNQANTRLFVAAVSRCRVSRAQRIPVLQRELRHRRGDARTARGVVRKARRFLLLPLGRDLRAVGGKESKRRPASSSCSLCPSSPSTRMRPSSLRAAASARATSFSSRTTASSEDSTASCNTTSSS